jgi:ABC-type glycerol-3-phosphate transport system substrate-binding protein
MQGKFSRRDFIKYAGTAVAGVGLTACAPQVVTQIVKETQVVEKVVEKEGETVVITATPPPAETPVVVMWYEAQNHQPEYDSRIDEVQQKYNIIWKPELYAGGSGTTSAKLQTTLMAGFGFPDIYEGNADTYPPYLQGAEEEIPFASLNDVLDISPYKDSCLEARWGRFIKDGKKFACPHDVHSMLLLYNDAAWKEYDVDLSTVVLWDDFLAMCQKVGKDAKTADGQPRIILYDDFTYGPIHKIHMLEQELWWTDKDGKSMIPDPRMKTSVESELRFKDFLVSIDWGNGPAQFKAGQAMAYLAPDWMFGIHKQASQADEAFMANSPIRLTLLPDLTPDGNKSGTWGGTGAAVVRQTKNKEAAANMLFYLYFDDSNHQMAARWKAMGILPPVVSSWTDPAMNEPDPYLGGQQAGTLFIEAAKKMPMYYENYKTPLVSAAYGAQISLVLSGDKTVDQALADAETKAQEDIAKAV